MDYLAIKWNALESVLMRWMNLEPIIQSEGSQKYGRLRLLLLLAPPPPRLALSCFHQPIAPGSPGCCSQCLSQVSCLFKIRAKGGKHQFCLPFQVRSHTRSQ